MKLLAVLPLLFLFQAPGPIPTPGPGPVQTLTGASPVPLKAADPAAPISASDPVHFDCLASGADGNPIVMKAYWNEFPFQSLSLLFEQLKPVSTDKTAPVISSVMVGLVNVLGNAGKILPASNGAPFSISAGDDVAITHAGLFVDGNPVPAVTAADIGGLTSLFYLRWNARVVAPGSHALRLVVWDAAGNPAEKNWVMFR